MVWVRLFVFGVSLGVGSFWFGASCASKSPPKIVAIEETREMPVIVSTRPENKPLKVMVIDTGISVHPWLTDFVQYDDSSNYKDNYGHGTHVAGIIAYGNHMVGDKDPLCDRVEIFSCAYYDKQGRDEDNIRRSIDCIKRATAEGMDYINFSAGGVLPSEDEYNAYKEFTEHGGVVVVAAGNEGYNLSMRNYYPASYAFDRPNFPGLKNFFIVSNVDREGRLHRVSNHHEKAFKEEGVDILSTLPDGMFGYMTGTSQAAPAFLHTILRQECNQNTDLRHASK